ncbi:MAG: DUF308 domain-containing protein [Oscillospiraceae bacterium]|nr:DUF308 domain-containing protein [Oscillospiraceae bacterium]MDD4369151.1 DUF308 domain-containing protein [Oscillospiraceae bacterium]
MNFKRIRITESIFAVLFIGLAILTWAFPGRALESLAVFYGAAALLSGLVDLLLYLWTRQKSPWFAVGTLLPATISVIAGILLVSWPQAAAKALAIVFAIGFIAHSIAKLSGLSALRRYVHRPAYYLSLIMNLSGLGLGIVLLFSPYLSALLLNTFIGLALLALGLSSLRLALENWLEPGPF